MDKKSIIGMVLIFLIFVGYLRWVMPSKEEQLKMAQTADSIKKAEEYKAFVADSLAAAQALQDSLRAAGDSTVATVATTTKDLGAFTAATRGEVRNLTVHSDLMTIDFCTKGARVDRVVLEEYKTYDSNDLVLITPSEENMNLVFSTENPSRVINTKDLVFTPFVNGKRVESGEWRVENEDSLTISFRAEIEGDSNLSPLTSHLSPYLEFVYTVRGGSHEVGFDINFVGLDKIVHNTPYLDFQWQNRMQRQEKVNEAGRGKANRNSDRERYYSSIYYKSPSDKNPDNLGLGQENKSKQVKTNLDWVAFKQQYFAAIMTAEGGQAFENAELTSHTDKNLKDSRYLTDMSAVIGLTYDKDNPSIHAGFYYGPTKMRDLRKMHRGYDRMLPLGWTVISKSISRWLIIPVFNFLERFNWNYGIIIIVFTLLIRLVLLPLVFKSYQGGAIMRILKPEMEALNKKYPNQEQAMQKQQAMMALQKKAGYNPMAGCLPVLIQMPFLTAMFMFFPIAIELRQKPFLWCDDLSNFDSILDFGTTILWQDHLSLFCLLMFGMQFFYTWYTMRQQAGTQSMPGMKFMMYFMPFMMFFIFNSQSAGLNLYYLISLTFTMTTMILIRQFTSEKRVRARMAAYDAKHAGKNAKPKKSSFAKRLEELQKQAEAMQKQQNKR